MCRFSSAIAHSVIPIGNPLYPALRVGACSKLTLQTLKPLVVGVGIAASFGVIFGITMGLYRGFQWIGEPIFVVMQAAPMGNLIPLVTFVYGIGLVSKVAALSYCTRSPGSKDDALAACLRCEGRRLRRQAALLEF